MVAASLSKFYCTTLAATDWMVQEAAEMRMFEHVQDSTRVDLQENASALFRNRNKRLDGLVEMCFGSINIDRLRGHLGLHGSAAGKAAKAGKDGKDGKSAAPGSE